MRTESPMVKQNGKMIGRGRTGWKGQWQFMIRKGSITLYIYSGYKNICTADSTFQFHSSKFLYSYKNTTDRNNFYNHYKFTDNKIFVRSFLYMVLYFIVTRMNIFMYIYIYFFKYILNMYKTLLFSPPYRKIFLYTKHIFLAVLMNKTWCT